MKIHGVAVPSVNIPLEAPIRWAWGSRTGVTRALIRLHTDAGVEDLGVTLARDRFELAARHHVEQDDLGSVGDPGRPDFIPAKQLW